LLIPVANLPPMSTIPAQICRHCQPHQPVANCHRNQWHQFQLRSCCHTVVNWGCTLYSRTQHRIKVWMYSVYVKGISLSRTNSLYFRKQCLGPIFGHWSQMWRRFCWPTMLEHTRKTACAVLSQASIKTRCIRTETHQYSGKDFCFSLCP
jgi:hypothetical protein